MSAFVCLLRGINVGGNNKIKMRELEAALGGQGFGDVRTYIQSGNIVFTSDAAISTDDLETQVETVIAENFGLTVPAMVITRERFQRAVQEFPFGDELAEKSVLVFVSGEGSDDWVARAKAKVGADDQLLMKNGVVYVYCPNGISKSKAAESLLATPKRGVKATMRNWRTTGKLTEMLNEMES